jgi:RAB6-interacting golgin
LSLAELDCELQQDVSILRKEIESATLTFNKHEKEYCAIEKSFLQKKQELYLAHERKELLTEHLYTIIQYNEDRKAKKLTELMDKVGLSLSENAT